MLIATEPAKFSVPAPPAPDFDSASKVFVLSPLTVVIPAVRERPLAVTEAPGETSAVLLTWARLMATPAPMASDPPWVAASPSPVAEAWVLALEERVSVAPVTVTLTPVGSDASLVAVTMLKATAAAALMPEPPLLPVELDGVFDVLEPLVPAPCASL